jgi:hypothetical protein
VVDHAFGQPAQHDVEHGVDQHLLRAEVLVDGLQRHIGGARHFLQADLVEVAVGEQVEHGAFDARQGVGAHAGQGSTAVDHGDGRRRGGARGHGKRGLSEMEIHLTKCVQSAPMRGAPLAGS